MLSFERLMFLYPKKAPTIAPSEPPPTLIGSVDRTPWNHPYLQPVNIQRFRAYSESVWDFAGTYARRQSSPLNIAFCVNMAQTAYRLACMTQQFGARSTVYPHPQDLNALSQPEWEEFDGEAPDVHDRLALLDEQLTASLRVPCRRIPNGDVGHLAAIDQFNAGNRLPLFRLLAKSSVKPRIEPLLYNPAFYNYLLLAQALAEHEVSFSPSVPIFSYLSGRPYTAFCVGGDLQIDCGRSDFYGTFMSLAFNAARFLFISNPHPLGHCRRLGFANALYLPLPIDDDRYCPGEGQARKLWESQHGKGVYVLSTARIDNEVKGNGDGILPALLNAARTRPSLRFVFLSWGHSAEEFAKQIQQTDVGRNFLFLKPVGKKRLIDYYRSCDAVLDQFVYGYYGATGLEAAATGKPLLIRMRSEHYAPLYKGDSAPVFNIQNPKMLYDMLVTLVDNPRLVVRQGEELRSWLVRNHGRKRTIPLLLALLRLAADQAPLPADLSTPLLDPETPEEVAYHLQCLEYEKASGALIKAS